MQIAKARAGFPGALESGRPGRSQQLIALLPGVGAGASAARSKLSIASAVIPRSRKIRPKRGGHEAQARRARGGLKRRDAFVDLARLMQREPRWYSSSAASSAVRRDASDPQLREDVVEVARRLLRGLRRGLRLS